MENPLIINIRCTCIEEYIRIQELHQEYKRQKKEGDILSIFVGSDEVIKGKYEIVDKLMKKCNQCRKAPAVAFYPKTKTQMTEEDPNSGLAVEQSSISEFAVGDRDEEFHCPVESSVHKSFAFEEEPVPDSLFKKVPEVLTEPDFSQATPSVVEESDDGWNGEDHNYSC